MAEETWKMVLACIVWGSVYSARKGKMSPAGQERRHQTRRLVGWMGSLPFIIVCCRRRYCRFN